MAADWSILSKYFPTGASTRAKANARANAQERGRQVSDLNKARKIAEPLGILVEKDTAGGWWVTCPSLKVPDPFDGGNFCSGGSEVLEMVQEYQKLIAN